MVDLLNKNGDYPELCKRLPEGMWKFICVYGLLFVKVWSRIIDMDVVPAWIHLCCDGGLDGFNHIEPINKWELRWI